MEPQPEPVREPVGHVRLSLNANIALNVPAGLSYDDAVAYAHQRVRGALEADEQITEVTAEARVVLIER